MTPAPNAALGGGVKDPRALGGRGPAPALA